MRNKKQKARALALIWRNPLLWLLPFAAAAVLLLVLARPAKADEFDSQIAKLNADIARSQSQVAELNRQQDTLNNKIAALNAQIDNINQRIALNEIKRKKLNAQIKAANEELKKKKEVLAANVQLIYRFSSVTPLEMLFASDSLSHFIDRQQYLERVKDNVQKAAQRIVELKKQLEEEKKELVALIAAQEAQQKGLATIRNEQAELLDITEGQESAYQKIIDASNKQLQGIYAERARRDAANGTGVSVGGTGGYPYANSEPDQPDPWGFLTRECTSFAAWKRRAIGNTPYPSYWGNAGDWTDHAPSDTTPAVGDIAVWYAGHPAAGSFGHVAVVEAVNANGTIDVSEYNWRPFAYTYRTNVPTAGLRFIY